MVYAELENKLRQKLVMLYLQQINLRPLQFEV